jgi:hypothetical protein
MAEDELDEEFDPEAIEEELDDEVEELDDELDDDPVAVVVDDDVDDEDEVVEEPVARVKKKGDDEDDDDDELDPDDVEADLDAILKDRIAAADEDEDDEDEAEAPPKAADTPDGVVPKRANEFTCMGCFLLVNRNQFGPANDLQCPVGESDCPAIEEILHPSVAKVVKAERPAAKAGKGARKR